MLLSGDGRRRYAAAARHRRVDRETAPPGPDLEQMVLRGRARAARRSARAWRAGHPRGSSRGRQRSPTSTACARRETPRTASFRGRSAQKYFARRRHEYFSEPSARGAAGPAAAAETRAASDRRRAWCGRRYGSGKRGRRLSRARRYSPRPARCFRAASSDRSRGSRTTTRALSSAFAGPKARTRPSSTTSIRPTSKPREDREQEQPCQAGGHCDCSGWANQGAPLSRSRSACQ